MVFDPQMEEPGHPRWEGANVTRYFDVALESHAPLSSASLPDIANAIHRRYMSVKMQSTLLSVPISVSPFRGLRPKAKAGLPCLPMRRRLEMTVHSSQKQQPSVEGERSLAERLALPVAATLAASLLLGAALPEDALAARSGGRVGGSSFRSSAPRSAPSAPRSRCTAACSILVPSWTACMLSYCAAYTLRC